MILTGDYVKELLRDNDMPWEVITILDNTYETVSEDWVLRKLGRKVRNGLFKYGAESYGPTNDCDNFAIWILAMAQAMHARFTTFHGVKPGTAEAKAVGLLAYKPMDGERRAHMVNFFIDHEKVLHFVEAVPINKRTALNFGEGRGVSLRIGELLWSEKVGASLVLI